MAERTTRILAGIISLILISGVVYFGVKVQAAGALKPKYQVEGLFTAAGQGLQSQSDVKIHGVNIGRVRSVRLKEGRALVRMDIDKGQRIPVSANAVIRPKTLFGEKFVDIDPGPNETTGPFLKDEGVINETLGGFELEEVLSDLYPILKAVNPKDLSTVIGVLADSGEGMGPAINRQIANFALLADIQARHDANFRQFLDDLVLLSDELGDRSGDIIAGARDFNQALPPINERSDELAAFLDQAGRLSTDLADLLGAHQSLMEKGATKGGKPIEILFERRAQIVPFVEGLRTFFQVLAEVGHLEKPEDGTNYAAVKFIIGEECPEGRVEPCGENSGTTNTSTTMAQSARRNGNRGARPPGTDVPIIDPALTPFPVPSEGADGVVQLLEGLLR